jgi:hypothetical protein
MPAQAKSLRTPSPPIKARHGGILACHPSYLGSINRRIAVQADSGINGTLF